MRKEIHFTYLLDHKDTMSLSTIVSKLIMNNSIVMLINEVISL